MAWVPRSGRVPSFTWAETVTADTTSSVIKIFPISSARNVSVTAKPGSGGTANVQFTTSSDAKIDADTANWQDWFLGAVFTIAIKSIPLPITGLRFIAIDENADFEVVI